METYKANALGIKQWAEEDRPREKLLLKGRQNLTDAELIAILLGSGSRNESAVSLAKRMLSNYQYNLHELGKSSVKDLTKFKGIGAAKAITISAALELGRRRHATKWQEKPQITNSKDAFDILRASIADLIHEEFWILLLNRANKVIGKEQISSGGISGTVVDAKVIFRKALEISASSLILAHNHPSGQLRPSQADIDITKRLVNAGKTLEVSVLDHLIVTEKGYLSFADEGMM